MLYFNERLHKADHRGQLAVRGLALGAEIPVKIFGDGFGMWEGSFTADRAQVVITVPGGAVIEQQVLSARRFSPDEVKVRWQAYDPQGRETKSGQGRLGQRNRNRAGHRSRGRHLLAVGPSPRFGHHHQRTGRGLGDRPGRAARSGAGTRSRDRGPHPRCRHTATAGRRRSELRTGFAHGVSRPRHRPGRARSPDRHRWSVSARGSRCRALPRYHSRRGLRHLAPGTGSNPTMSASTSATLRWTPA